jgi:phosphoesterase RecJ-like protein
MFETVIATIRNYNRIIIHRHKNPDGDALGSQLGLAGILKENFPEKEILSVGDTSARYAFMGYTPDEVSDDAYTGALAIILDTSSSALISDERYKLAEKTIRLDHHIFCEEIADVEVTDTSFESCCGLITAFAMECALKVPSSAAKALYTGMITDSGRFRYDSVTSQTFRCAAFLMEQDFRTDDIYRNLYADDFSFIQLRARYVLKIQLTDCNVAYIYTTKEEVKELGISVFSASRGMVNTMADIRGTDIWVNFTEDEEGILCEIRSGGPNINPIAVKYGGGGHAKASGATVPDFETAMAMLKDLDEMAKGEAK